MAHLVLLLSSWFGSGLIPKAPGTWGSLAALPFAWGLVELTGTVLSLWPAAALLFVIGIWVSAERSKQLGSHDAGEIVIDEVVGQWMVLAVAPYTLAGWVLAFLLFRLFDILKPWPIRLADKKVSGGFGIMLDDVLAALFGIAVLLGIRLTFGEF